MKKKIMYECPHCPEVHKIDPSELTVPIPKNNPNSDSTYKIAVLVECSDENEKKYAEIEIGQRKNEYQNLTVVSTTKIKNLIYNNFFLGKNDEQENDEQQIPLTYFRPKNFHESLDLAVKKNVFKTDERVKKIAFNYLGKTGFFLYNDNSVAFVSNSEQSSSSLEKIINGYENISSALISKKLKKLIKKKKRVSEQNIDFYFFDSPNNIEKLNEIVNERRKKHNSSENISNYDFSDFDNLSFLKKISKQSLKKSPSLLAKIFAANIIPGAALGLIIYEGIKAKKLINKLNNTLESERSTLLDIENSIGDRTIEQYNSDLNNLQSNYESNVQLRDQYFDEIKPGTEGNDYLQSLDNFFTSNGAQAVDVDGDGFTDYYILPDETVVEDPFSVIPEGYIPDEDLEGMQEAWNNLQEYESSRFNANESNNLLEEFISNNNNLIELYSNKELLLEKISGNLENLSSTQGALNLLYGFGITLGVGMIASFAIGKQVELKNRKLFYGSKLRALNLKELDERYKHIYFVSPKKISEQQDENLFNEITKLEEIINAKKNDLEELKKCDLNDLQTIEPLKKYFSDLTNFDNFISELKNNNEFLKKQESFKSKYDFIISSLSSNPLFKKKFDSADSIEAIINDSALMNSDQIKKFNLNNNYELIDELKNIAKWVKNNNLKIKNETRIKKVLNQKIDEMSEENHNLSVELNDKKMKYSALKKIMYENLISNPELIFTKNYLNFEGEFYDDFVEQVILSRNDLDVARKGIKKIIKKIKKAKRKLFK